MYNVTMLKIVDWYLQRKHGYDYMSIYDLFQKLRNHMVICTTFNFNLIYFGCKFNSQQVYFWWTFFNIYRTEGKDYVIP